MPLVRAYLAVSLDGFIAGKDGGVDWLTPYNDPSLGFSEFMSSIEAVIVGRTTFDHALKMGGWQESGMRTIVLTDRPLDEAPRDVEPYRGDLHELVAELKKQVAGDIWHMGGGRALAPFLRDGLIDRWELFVIPVLLGGGVPLFPPGDNPLASFRMTKCQAHKRGVVELHYEPVR